MSSEKDMPTQVENAPDTLKGEERAQPVMDENWHKVSKSIVRKLDMTLMPIIWLLYLLNYLDRNSIA